MISELVSLYSCGELVDIDRILKQRGHVALFPLPRVGVLFTGMILVSVLLKAMQRCQARGYRFMGEVTCFIEVYGLRMMCRVITMRSGGFFESQRRRVGFMDTEINYFNCNLIVIVLSSLH